MATMPEGLTWEDVRNGIARLCEERGWHHGVPIMSTTDTGRSLVLARGCPMADKLGHDVPIDITGAPYVHVCRTEDIQEDGGPYFVNEWIPSPRRVVSYREKGKAKRMFIDLAEDRFQMYVKSLLCQAGAVDVMAEIKALAALTKRITKTQWECYMLGNAFPETSSRSGVTYIFRKGRPTIAMRCVRRPDGSGEDRHFLAALCSHPLGWYSSTHVGCYPPTDEVVANLLQMRADEHCFWKKSIQYGLQQVEAGI